MDAENMILYLAIIAGLVVLLIVVFVILGYSQASQDFRKGVFGKSKEESTTFLDEGEDEKKCEICYGKIDDNMVAVCACGRIFHEACARPTGSCPYCGKAYESMAAREPARATCRVCGKFIKGNICSCGAIFPRRDDSFVCTCGNRVDRNKPVCKKCGAVYENTTMLPIKE